jgi:flagellar hook-associated protein 2
MAISAAGVGSGLDVQSIVSQLVAIEKQPLKQLQTKASSFQTQLSLYGKIKSQASALGDAAALLAGPNGWNAQKATSSNTAAVGVIASSSASNAVFSVEVQQLARAQSSASLGITKDGAAGAEGNLEIELGTWSEDVTPTFTPGSSVSVSIAATDTVGDIATKINASNAGVVATVLRDGANERLVVKSTTTGGASGFRLNTPVAAGLGSLGLTNPSNGVGFVGQTALDAKVKINGIAVASASNKMADVVAGVTLQLNQVTTSTVDVSVANDQDAVQKNIQGFVDAYNALNSTLADATKYTAATKTAGALQGDVTTVGLQNALRSMMGSTSSGSTFSYLSDVGIERQTDGSLKVNTTKLTSAQQDLPNLKNLFTADNGNTSTNGFGLKVRDFSRGLVAFDGLVSNKSTALQGSITRNSKDQDRVNERASRVESQLFRQYSALDAQMAQLNGLNSYVTAQLAQWNKSSS